MNKQCDTRVKMLVSLVLSALCICLSDIVWLAVLSAVTLILTLIFKVNFKGFFRRFSPYLKIVIFVAIIQSVFNVDGAALIVIGDLKFLTINGLILAAMFILRVFIIFSAGLIISTSDMRTSLQGLSQMHIPNDIAFATLITIKYIPILKEEFSDRTVSIQLRGVNFKKLSFVKKMKLYTTLLLPTLSGSILKAKKLALSLEAKGFKCQKKRTSYFYLKFRWFDYLIMLVALAATVTTLYFYYTQIR